jgi:hypothetical protein
MTKPPAPDPPELWTGVISLELLDPYDRQPAGSVEIQVCQNDLHLKRQTRLLATIDRERFTCWLANPHVRYVAGTTEWTTHAGVTSLRFGEVDYVIAPESLDLLTTALHQRLPISPVPENDDPGVVPAQGPGRNGGTA